MDERDMTGSLLETGPGVLTWNIGSNTSNALVTTAIGGDYAEDFIRFSLPSWQLYAKRHNLGIILLSDGSFSASTMGGLNGAWLKMLAPSLVLAQFPQVTRVAVVDTDIVINPSSPDVFLSTPRGSVGVVRDLPRQSGEGLMRTKRVAFLRNRYYDQTYPLDSILFAHPEDLYAFEGFPSLPDAFCTGLIVLDLEFATRFEGWFLEAKEIGAKETGAWEQTFLNFKILSELPSYWLDGKFQAIWNFEMATNHPSLYQSGDLADSEIAEHCVADTLNRVYFLHFAGSWPESRAWRNNPSAIFEKMGRLHQSEFLDYLESVPTGAPVGKLLPPTVKESL
jgi:hypothetical protein